MTYLTLHRSKFRFQVAIVCFLIVAFLLALILMFVHPTFSFAVFFVSLVLTGVASVVLMVFGKAEKIAATHELAQHHCPNCGEDVHRDAGADGDWLCNACGADFMPSGVERV